jgi:diguanylate cyclase (GGDEF)-like protein
MARRAAAKKVVKIKLTRIKELEALYRVTEIAQSGHAFAGALHMMAIEIGTAAGFPIAAIQSYDQASQTLEMKAARGIEITPGLISANKNLSGTVVHTARPLLHQEPADEFWIHLGVKTYCGFPLMVGKRCAGVLSLAHFEQVEMDPHLQKWVMAVATFLASYIQSNLASEMVVREKKKRPILAAKQGGTGQDELTNLPNAELFRFLLTQALSRARRSKDMVAILFIDIDHFKAIRTSSGEETANNMIRQVAERVRRSVREGDSVARWSDDQFIWLISNIQNMDGVAMIAEKMLAIIKRPVTVDGKAYNLTTTIGISLYPYDGGDTETLITHAKTALARAKELGRDTYHFFRDEVNSKVFEQLNFKRALREGLDKQEFVLHYQPIVEVDSGRITAVEAFVRWQGPDGKLTYPAEFVTLSEDTGLIALLDQWVLKTACEQAKRWQSKADGPMRVSVNISNRLFQQQDLVERVAQIISQSGIRPELVELELTENAVMEEPDRSAQILSRLKELGVHISIDNFGTAGFSLSHFKQFPISTLKIDPVFVRESANNPNTPSLASAIISMARALHLTVVAESIESEAELNLLRANKCHCYQGNLFSPPVPAKQFEEILSRLRASAPAPKAVAPAPPKPQAPPPKSAPPPKPSPPKTPDAEHMPWPVAAAIPEKAPAQISSAPVRKPVEEHLPWPVSAAITETEQEARQVAEPPSRPEPTPKTSGAMLMVPRNLERLPDAKNYLVTCYNCRNRYDAIETTWCSCLTSERTLVCPSCLKCFCGSALEYKIDFWAEAPRTMWDRRVKEEARFAEILPNPEPDKVKRPLILVVDDEIPILSMAASALQGLGFGVVTAVNGEEGLHAARLYNPNVVLSDALMPKMDGREMCKQLKVDPKFPNLKVIIMSSLSYSGRQRSGAFREFRIDEYLQKPVDFYLLRSILEKFLA